MSSGSSASVSSRDGFGFVGAVVGGTGAKEINGSSFFFLGGGVAATGLFGLVLLLIGFGFALDGGVFLGTAGFRALVVVLVVLLLLFRRGC